jgi:hypothetical protein
MELPKTMNSKPTLRSYLRFILSSPISVWWGVATAVIEMVSFGLVSDTIALSKWWLLIVILIVSFSTLIGFLVVWKAWPLYSRTYERIAISQIVHVDDEHVFLLEGLRSFKQGSMFEVYRTTEDVDVSIGLVQATFQQENGTVQAKPVWIKPGHLRDIETGALSVRNLRAYQTLNNDTLSRWIDDRAEALVQDLLRRGAEG